MLKPSVKKLVRKNADFKPIENIQVAPNRWIGDDQPCFIIAEVGQNHNGEMTVAKELIDNVGFHRADAVKLCKRSIRSEMTRSMYDSPYVGPQSFGATYGAHREHLELSVDQYRELKDYAESKGLVFFASVCSEESVDDLEGIGISLYKIASRDLTNLPLIDHVAAVGKPILLSCGMDSLAEIARAIETIRKYHNQIVLLQCTSSYPTPYEEVNIRVMHTLRREFDVLVGMSDHTIGYTVAIAAAVLGAVVVEKHVTLARHMKGTDHACSLEPEGLRRYVRDIRNLELALGDGVKRISPAIDATKAKLCRSLVSAQDIMMGQS